MNMASDRNWQLEVTEKLGALVQQTRDLTEQVKRQNGNVARLWEHMGAVEQHPASCPLNVRVSDLEQWTGANEAANEAADKAKAPLHRWAERIAFTGLGVFVLLVLMHGPEIIKAWK